eukprot:352478-Chlamydomonas_euryale.AAC.12
MKPACDPSVFSHLQQHAHQRDVATLCGGHQWRQPAAADGIHLACTECENGTRAVLIAIPASRDQLLDARVDRRRGSGLGLAHAGGGGSRRNGGAAAVGAGERGRAQNSGWPSWYGRRTAPTQERRTVRECAGTPSVRRSYSLQAFGCHGTAKAADGGCRCGARRPACIRGAADIAVLRHPCSIGRRRACVLCGRKGRRPRLVEETILPSRRNRARRPRTAQAPSRHRPGCRRRLRLRRPGFVRNLCQATGKQPADDDSALRRGGCCPSALALAGVVGDHAVHAPQRRALHVAACRARCARGAMLCGMEDGEGSCRMRTAHAEWRCCTQNGEGPCRMGSMQDGVHAEWGACRMGSMQNGDGQRGSMQDEVHAKWGWAKRFHAGWGPCKMGRGKEVPCRTGRGKESPCRWIQENGSMLSAGEGGGVGDAFIYVVIWYHVGAAMRGLPTAVKPCSACMAALRRVVPIFYLLYDHCLTFVWPFLLFV